MTDAELQAWWPDLATVIAQLRRIDRPAVAAARVEAVRAGATSSEILGGVSVVLREHRALRSLTGDAGLQAWDGGMANVNRAFPGSRRAHWFARLTRRSN